MADSDLNRKPFVVEPFHLHFKPGIDPNKLNQLLDELDGEAYLELVEKLKAVERGTPQS